MRKVYLCFYFFTAAILFATSSDHSNKSKKIFDADVIVYGGTSAAVTSAVQTAKMGKSVIIVSPAKHLGGMSSSGLGFTDIGNKSVIGGLSREFYQRIYKYYQKPETWK